MSTIDTTGSLRVQGLSRVIGQKILVRDASFEVPGGGLIALVGPNGAGKSTLLRLISSTSRSDPLPDGAASLRPRVVLGDVDLLDLRRRERARQVALVEQEARAEFDLTVRQVVELGRIPHQSAFGLDDGDHGVVDEAMARTGVAVFAERQLGTLSGGEQQRVQLARALAQKPRLLLLDEPTNHLDVRAQLETLALLREIAEADGLTVVAALHDLNLAAGYCDQVVVLQAGLVRDVGSVERVLDPALIEQVYGVAADVVPHPRTGRPLIAFSVGSSERRHEPARIVNETF